MDRRQFIQSAGTVTAASLVTATRVTNVNAQRGASAEITSSPTTGSWFDPTNTWHFYDLWHFDLLGRVWKRGTVIVCNTK